MAAASTIGIAGLALAAVGTGVQFVAQRRQAKAQEKAADAQDAQRRLQAKRQRRRVIRQRRIARAQIENMAAQTGAAGGSGEAGGISSLGAQAGFELGFINQTKRIGDVIGSARRDAARAAGFGSIGSGMTSIGGSIFGNSRALSGFLSGGSNPTQRINAAPHLGIPGSF